MSETLTFSDCLSESPERNMHCERCWGLLVPSLPQRECPGVWRRTARVCDALPPWETEGRASVSVCPHCGPSQRLCGPGDCGSCHLSAEPRESQVKSKISSKNPVPSSLLMKPRPARGFELLQENRSSNTEHANVQKSHSPHQTNDLKQQCSLENCVKPRL